MRTRTLILLLAATLLCFAAGKQKPKSHRPRAAADRTKTTQSVIEPDAVNNPQLQDIVGPDSKGAAVVRAQILLDRAHFSPGEIDGHYGDNLRVAILGYQSDRKLQTTGTVDADTWRLLNSDSEPPLVPYMVTQEDVEGPFEKIPDDMEAKAKLPGLGFSSVQEALGEKFHIQPALLTELNKGKDLSKAGEQIMVPHIQRESVAAADRVVVSKTDRTVTALRADNRILAKYPATIGSEHDPLPIGDWQVTVIEHNPWFNYNPALFWDSKESDAKARIPPGPNNPVGIVWIGLSKEHYGIHGTPEPGAIGHSESHGCIRLTNWDAEELSHMVKLHTPVLLQE